MRWVLFALAFVVLLVGAAKPRFVLISEERVIPKGYGLASLEHLDEGFLSEYARLGGVPARKEASLACVIRVQEGVLPKYR